MSSSAQHGHRVAVHDWNFEQDGANASGASSARAAQLFDDTLRDGLQNASVVDPGIEGKTELLEAMRDVGVEFAGIGMPSASRRQYEECRELCRAALNPNLSLTPVCAARALEADVNLALRLSDAVGGRIELHIFLGTSSIRAMAEQWPPELLRQRTASSVRLATRAGVEVAFVAEDASRSHPETLAELFRTAIGEGATRLCLCDTVGAMTPRGTRRIVTHARQIIAESNAAVGLDWHGHNDRGLALANTLEAWQAGADRLHGTALGVGERVGNTPMELLVLNLHLAGDLPGLDPRAVVRYGQRAAALLKWPVPFNYPLLGADAFRTATGVHAAAIRKAEAQDDPWLAERVYSAFAASQFGREQEICVGHASGASNVIHWLQRNRYLVDQGRVERILKAAKSSRGVLSEGILHTLASAEQPER